MANKNKRNRRTVLATSCILAALIVAGSSFAWFTSKDEVVNKLSANNEYNVTTYEDFTPPSNWTPGQAVTKKVGVTNTGNIPAFVRSVLTGSMNLTYKLTTGDSVYNSSNTADYIELYRGESDITADLPDTPAQSKNEVIALQAGGRLVCQPNTTDSKKIDIDENGNLNISENFVSSKDFVPTSEGLYVFLRSNKQEGGEETTPVYVGYYFVPGADSTSAKYYAVTIKEDESNSGKYKATIDKTKTTTVDNNSFKYELDTTNNIVKATYTAAADAIDSSNIVINIKLANTGSSQAWTVDVKEDTTNNKHYAAFYYNHILGAGESSSNFIESVTLDKETANNAFVSMDYNLKVTTESAQAVDSNNNGTYENTAVNEQNWDKEVTNCILSTSEQIAGEEGTVTWDNKTTG